MDPTTDSDEWLPEPIYRPVEDGRTIVLYSGELEVTHDGESHRIHGEVRLDNGPGGPLVAHVASDQAWLAAAFFSDSDPTVALVEPLDLAPPRSSTVPHRGTSGGWSSGDLPLDPQSHGDPTSATQFVVHIASPLKRLPYVKSAAGGVEGAQFHIAGWSVRLIKASGASDGEFSHVARCRHEGVPPRVEDVERLQWRIHTLLGFVAGHEVNVGPVAGLDENGAVVFAMWGAGRDRTGRPGVYWCTEPLLGDAIESLSVGFGRFANDEALLRVLDRGIGHLLAATAQSEVLDLRIPIACTGIELMAWANLQRRGWLGRDALAKLRAGSTARLLLQSCRIPVQLPDHFEHLPARIRRIGQPDWGGPEVLFNIRNSLVHPPKRLDEPEWPSGDELLEAWLLATWYLELVLLETLGYSGKYWCRLRLGRSVWDTEPVPWASPPPSDVTHPK